MSTMIRVIATLNRAIAEHRLVDVRHGDTLRRLEPQAMGNSPSSGPLLLAWERSPQPGWRFIVAAELAQAVCLPECFGVRCYPNDTAGPVREPAVVVAPTREQQPVMPSIPLVAQVPAQIAA